MSQELVRKVYTGEVLEKPGNATVVLSPELAAALTRFRESVDQAKLATIMAGVATAYHPGLRAISTAEIIDQETAD